jgi:transcriptional regulator with XRE-family HTH domain
MLAQNLKFLRAKYNLSQSDLAEKMGIPRTTLSAYERSFVEPNIQLLRKLGEFFSVQIDDLVSLSIEEKQNLQKSTTPLKVLAITVDSENKNNIELVNTKAEAGYLDGYGDPEFIRDLPKISIPNIPQGTYRGFEVRGESMLPLESGSIIISSYVENLTEIKNEKTYVIISKSDGVVYKRVKNLPEENALLLISDNDYYKPYKIAYEEISEIWQYFAHISFSDKIPILSLNEKLTSIDNKLDQVLLNSSSI